MPQKLILYINTFAIGILVSFGVVLAASQWYTPTSNPPGNNADIPLNVSSIGQIKEGGLTINTGGAATGLIVSKGNVGIGTSSPSEKLDVSGNVKATGFCIGLDCKTSWDQLGGGSGSVGAEANYVPISVARSLKTIYQNTGSTPRLIYATILADQEGRIYIGSSTPPNMAILVTNVPANPNRPASFTFFVPPGWYYKATGNEDNPLGGANARVLSWFEAQL